MSMNEGFSPSPFLFLPVAALPIPPPLPPPAPPAPPAPSIFPRRAPVAQSVATRAVNPGVVSSNPGSANFLSDD